MGIRIKHLRLSGMTAVSDSYDISFHPQGASDGFRALSVIAGPSQTGKTTIVDFISYLLGDDHLPRHAEIRSHVRAAILNVDLAAEPVVIERSTVGGPSSFASVWEGSSGSLDSESEMRLSIEPTSDPAGLSQYVLASMHLDGVLFPDSSKKEETKTAVMSIRDLFRVFVVPNERLDNKDLVFERSNYMVAQKYRQSVDVMFGVHDNEAANLALQVRNAAELLRTVEGRLSALRQVAERDYPEGPTELELRSLSAAVRVAEISAQIRALDAERRSSDRSSAQLRADLREAQRSAQQARVRVRDRESLLARLDALRGQYADNQRKLAFLVDAEVLFDPLQVSVCPACFNSIGPLTMHDGICGLCHHEVPSSPEQIPAAAPSDGEEISDEHDLPSDGSSAMVRAELRAVRNRLNSLSDYIGRLTIGQERLVTEADGAEIAATTAAAAIDAVTQAPAPWLALRDRLTAQLTDAKLLQQATATGARSWKRVSEEERRVEAARREVDELRRARRRARPDRDALVSSLSERFAEILADIGYPKLHDPYIDDKLVPHVRGLPYSEASSGGMVLVALAYNLALWEVSYEQQADAPGLIIIDSPQKNLGHKAVQGDDDFADALLVDRFYAHVKRWLATDGAGAQAIIIDNSPPPSVADDVVIRFTRNPGIKPYGLITDAIS